jgi:hypothetical protein
VTARNKPITLEQKQAALLLWRDHDYSENAASKASEVQRSAFAMRLTKARKWLKTPEGKKWGDANGIGAGSKPEIMVLKLTEQVKDLKKQLTETVRDNLSVEHIREHILGLRAATPSTPSWINDRQEKRYRHGIPTLLLSDLHYGEKVFPAQIFGANKFDSAICEARVMRTIDKTIMLTHSVLHEPNFPGIVLALGGDNTCGFGLHAELDVGVDKMNQEQIIAVADLLHSSILKLVKVFGKVFVVGVPGNHGRSTRKPWAKFYAQTNSDWLVYQILERFLKHQVDRGEVVFLCPPARDVTYRVAGRGFRLTHGDQFRGGDSIIGPLGPITRGDNKKRAMSLTLPTDEEEYDTLLVCHFHQLYQSPNLIINGSIKGYDEYAFGQNFKYEPPQQSLFLTHEKYGINHLMPVLADEPQIVEKKPWVEFRREPSVQPPHAAWSKS